MKTFQTSGFILGINLMASIALTALMVLMASGCTEVSHRGQGSSNGKPGGFYGQGQKSGLYRLVSDITENVILTGYRRLVADTKHLQTVVQEQCPSKKTLPLDRSKLKSAFLQAMRSYHFTEAFQVGTLARDTYQVKNLLYSWPHSNFILIDIEIAEKEKNKDYTYRIYPTSVGFPAMEYLIYEEKLLNQCQSCGPTLLEEWNKLDSNKKLESRCEYMKFVSDLLAKDTQKTLKAWGPVRGDHTLSETYQKDFKTLKSFIVQLTHSWMFFDREMKDHRLGIPSGINYENCGFDSCPTQSEHFFSKDSIASLLYTTRGLLALFTGDKWSRERDFHHQDFYLTATPGYGYEEWLQEKGHAPLAEKLKKSILQFVHHLEGQLSRQESIDSLAENISYKECKSTTSKNRVVEICALYQDLKKITDLYKTNLLLALDVGRPQNHGGDTD